MNTDSYCATHQNSFSCGWAKCLESVSLLQFLTQFNTKLQIVLTQLPYQPSTEAWLSFMHVTSAIVAQTPPQLCSNSAPTVPQHLVVMVAAAVVTVAVVELVVVLLLYEFD